MAEPRCPGRDSRNLKAETVRCACGYEVEIFSDEMRRRCPGCGREILRRRAPSCAQWCKSAEQCLGLPGRTAGRGKGLSGREK